MPADIVASLYKELTKAEAGVPVRDLKGDNMTARLAATVLGCAEILAGAQRRPLISKVPNKTYFMFALAPRTSRPVNEALFINNLNEAKLHRVLACDVAGSSSNEITSIIYTAAMTFCCAIDLVKSGDQKTPGTFFEILIGHLVAKSLGVNPEQQITVPTLDIPVTLPTDFVFDLGAGKNRVHLPVKASTRERVVQVWAHQRVLDGMHGVGRFKGVLVAMAETNKQKETSVTEVCLPNQWIAYQMYIAQMFRVYYLDLPQPYVRLKDTYPFLQVKQFGDFFSEVDKIEKSGAGGT